MLAPASNNLKKEIKQWLKHKKIVFETGHGYEHKKKVYEYVKIHLEMSDYSSKMINVMKDKLKELLPHEANPTFKHQQEILEQILNQIAA